MIYYIADQHFGHKQVINFDSRPFQDTKEMDQYMIDAHNSVVTDQDDVYFIGDVFYGNTKEYSWYLKQLNGKKHLIQGNHDGKLLKDNQALSFFESIDKMLFVMDTNVKIVLCHFPLLEWNGYYRGAYHIHGHIHNQKNEAFGVLRNMERALNASASIIGYKPCTFRDLIKYNEIYKMDNK